MKLGFIISVSVCLCVQTISAQLLPKADHSFWRDSIPVEMRQSYIEYGEQAVPRQAVDCSPLFSLLTVQDQWQPCEL